MGFEVGNPGGPGAPKRKPFLDWCKKWTLERAEKVLAPIAENPKHKGQLDAIKTIMAYGVGKPVETLDTSVEFGGVAADPNTVAGGIAELIARGEAKGLGNGAGNGAVTGPIPAELLDTERGPGAGNQ